MSKKEEGNYIECPECGCKSFRIYSKEELRKKFPDYDTNLIQQMSYANLAREFQCINSDCCFVFRASIKQMMNGLTRNDLTKEDLIKEFKEDVKKEDEVF